MMGRGWSLWDDWWEVEPRLNDGVGLGMIDMGWSLWERGGASWGVIDKGLREQGWP